LREVENKRAIIELKIDGQKVKVPSSITIKRALEFVGLKIEAPCGTGGCYGCVVYGNKKLLRSCITPVEPNMEIKTELPGELEPLRIIHGPQPHSVGGKATPWWLKPKRRYIEVAIWAAGCNLRCPQCQNFTTTYDGRTPPLTPKEAAKRVTEARRNFGVDRMAISGGEPTLNRKWLIEYFKELKRLNEDKEARLHLDSNGTLLSPDYIDELIEEEGVTDIGIEPKGLYPETFMKITGISSRDLADQLLSTSWHAIEYIINNYKNKVFLGVGLPYNQELIGMDEVYEFGKRLSKIDSRIQICVLDYFPIFRRRDMERPSVSQMLKVKSTLEDAGLKTVIAQTSVGHIGPG
jgi:pyruvate formate lyase activating enzyme